VHSITHLLIPTFVLCSLAAVFKFKQVLSQKVAVQKLHGPWFVLVLMLLALLAFSTLLYNSIMLKATANNNAGLYLSVGSAISSVGLIYLCAAIYYQIFAFKGGNRSHPFTTGILLLLAALTSLGTLARYTPFSLDQYGIGLYVHLVCSLAAYALFSIAALFIILQVWESQRIRKALPENLFLPNLEFLETQSFRWIAFGFILLTIALVTGALFLYDLRAQHLPHKVVLSLLSWVVFAILLIGRYRLGWRGKTALRWTLAGFALLALAYFGSKVILEVFLNRSWS